MGETLRSAVSAAGYTTNSLSNMQSFLVYFLLLSWSVLGVLGELNVCSFNVQSFGSTKASKPEIMKLLAKIFASYDLCLMQEIKDKSGDAMRTLQEYIGEEDSTYREQYAYIYKADLMSPEKEMVYDEPDPTMFDREPYVAKFNLNSRSLSELTVAGLHTPPHEAVKELQLMDDVYDWIHKTFPAHDALLMGDFNADCDYVKEHDFANIELWTEPRFHVLIPNDADTTVDEDTDCAYDRFVCGDGINSV